MTNKYPQPFHYIDNQLFAEGVPVQEIATQYDTPCYIYSRAYLEQQYLAYTEAFGSTKHLVCYAVKANSNLAVLNVLARLGAGFDIVSVGELERVIKAGGAASKIVFSGVAKSASEIQRALEVGIHCFNVESHAELELINTIASRMNVLAPVSLRVNPDVDAKTHPYISTGLKDNKFGIDISEALTSYQRCSELSHIQITGIDCHIGSQLTEVEPFLDALRRVLELVDMLENAGIQLEHIDVGGGLGVIYHKETPPSPSEYVQELLTLVAGRKHTILMEPGRSITANAGLLLTRVEYLKKNQAKNFALIDAGMNDMLRPSLYQAWLDILRVNKNTTASVKSYDIVGPVCETGDFLGKDRELALSSGDLLAVMSSGAYGFTMSSNYNSRPRAAEVMVDGDQCFLVRKRESIEDLMQGESLLP